VWESSCFLMVTKHREALCGLQVQGVEALISLGVFRTKCGSNVSAKFLVYRARTVYFCTLVAILNPPSTSLVD
jgi:hypothetical protein